MALDRTDVGILSLLQNDAALSNKQIAAAVGLAPSSAHERLKRLRDEGVLRGSHADVDPKAMGVGVEALLLIELSKHKRSDVERFMNEVVDIPEVRSAFLITGRHDFVVHVMARDMRHLKDLALDRFTNRPGVTRIETSIIFETRVRHELPRLNELSEAGGQPNGAQPQTAIGPRRRATRGKASTGGPRTDSIRPVSRRAK